MTEIVQEFIFAKKVTKSIFFNAWEKFADGGGELDIARGQP